MIESQQVLEWIAEGEARGRAEGRAKGEAESWVWSLLRVLEWRFPPGAPAEMAARIRAVADLEQLRRWFDLAFTADSLDAFRQVAGL